jgi:hypothetical protein
VKLLKLLACVHLAGNKRDRQRLAANRELARFDRIVAGQAQDQPAVGAFLLIPEQAGESGRIGLAQLSDESVAPVLNPEQFCSFRRVRIEHGRRTVKEWIDPVGGFQPDGHGRGCAKQHECNDGC